MCGHLWEAGQRSDHRRKCGTGLSLPGRRRRTTSIAADDVIRRPRRSDERRPRSSEDRARRYLPASRHSFPAAVVGRAGPWKSPQTNRLRNSCCVILRNLRRRDERPIKPCPPPAGFWYAFSARAVNSRLLVRESNPRQSDSWSDALPTELTRRIRRRLRQSPYTERSTPT